MLKLKDLLRIKKQHLSLSIHHFKLLLEQRDLSDIEYDSFLEAKNELTNVYKLK
jgi:hypothetical protein